MTEVGCGADETKKPHRYTIGAQENKMTWQTAHEHVLQDIML